MKDTGQTDLVMILYFFSHELNKCFGEASPEEKKSVSHRAKAFEKLMKDIDSIIK